jgi:protein-S-isoprenylcysteine O-methyltransferase Ste14
MTIIPSARIAWSHLHVLRFNQWMKHPKQSRTASRQQFRHRGTDARADSFDGIASIREPDAQRRMSLTAKNLLINSIYYGVTVVALPAACLALESMLGMRRDPTLWSQISGAVLIALGAALQVWCIILLQRTGRGTPSPAVPTSRLVTAGPYHRMRNPLNVGEVLVFLGLAAWFGSLLLVAYALAAWVAFHVFIVAVEEPRHRKEFGEAYTRYAHEVMRWIPR